MLDLTLNIGIGVNSFVSIPGLITAVSAPTMGSGLFEGQSIQDSEDFSSLTSTANYSSTTGEIISVVASPTGDAASISAPLSEGDLAGYQVTVHDDAGNSASFEASAITVGALVSLVVTDDNEADVTVHPNADDATEVDITISGTDDYDGTYTVTVADLRDGPASLTGVSVTGSVGSGATLIADTGMWTTPTGDLTLSIQWMRDGSPISGETSTTYVMQAADDGFDVMAVVTADDGVNPTVSEQSDPVSFESSGATVTELGSLRSNGVSSIQTISETIDVGAAETGKVLLLDISWGDQNAGTDASANDIIVTVDGSPVTSVASQIGGRENISIVSYDVSAGGSFDVEISLDSVAWRGISYRAWTVSGHATMTPVTGKETSPAPIDLSANVLGGDTVIGAAMLANDTSGGVTLTGLNLDIESPNRNGTKAHYHFSASVASTETPRAMSVDPEAGAAGSLCAALVVIN